MTSLPKNAYNEQLLGNVKRALITNHHHATYHRHRLTTMQDVIIASITINSRDCVRPSSSQRDRNQVPSRRENYNRSSSPQRAPIQQLQNNNTRNEGSYSSQGYDTRDIRSDNNGRPTPHIGAIFVKEKCPPQMLVITPYNVTIQPHNRTNIPLRLPYWRTSKILLLEPLYNINNLGLRLARTVVWINGSELCPVWNDTNRPITLKYETAIATISTIKDNLNFCSLEESIHAYKEAKNKRNTRGINNVNSNNTRRLSYTHNRRRSYANDRRHSYHICG